MLLRGHTAVVDPVTQNRCQSPGSLPRKNINIHLNININISTSYLYVYSSSSGNLVRCQAFLGRVLCWSVPTDNGPDTSETPGLICWTGIFFHRVRTTGLGVKFEKPLPFFEIGDDFSDVKRMCSNPKVSTSHVSCNIDPPCPTAPTRLPAVQRLHHLRFLHFQLRVVNH